jgi:hypothetical protein
VVVGRAGARSGSVREGGSPAGVEDEVARDSGGGRKKKVEMGLSGLEVRRLIDLPEGI